MARGPNKYSETSYEDYFKRRAHGIVAGALKNGTLVPGLCEKCGATLTVAHHESYLLPLEVNWLCRGCHQRHHAQDAWRTKKLKRLGIHLFDIVSSVPPSLRKSEPVLIAENYIHRFFEDHKISKLDKAILIQNARDELAKVATLPASYYDIPSINSII